MLPANLQLHLQPNHVALIVIDVQERLAQAMPPEEMAGCRRNILNLVRGAHRFGFPIVVTEQYPKGLGPSIPELRAELALKEGTPVIEKRHFSAAGVPEFRKALDGLHGKTLLVTGMEAHVCVFQTVRDLVESGYDVHLAADAVISRRPEIRDRGIELCRQAGAIISCTETILFDLLQVAEGELFKEISRMVK